MKESTQNLYQQAINQVVDYINSHLNEELSLDTLADISHLSPFHFHRIFSSIIGETTGAYITRLRLEMAAQQLTNTALSMSEITEICGYQSLHALSKAFKKQFNVTPSEFRNHPTHYSRIKQTRQFTPLDLCYTISELPAQHLAYARIIAKYGDEQRFREGWEKLEKYIRQHSLITTTTKYIGISFDSPHITLSEKCRFYACATVPSPIKPEGAIGSYTISAGRFAVYIHHGSYDNLQNTYDNIYRNPNKLEWRDSVSFEKYLNHPDQTEEKNLLTNIYIPIK